jgi:hypothetical protein
MTFTFNGKSVGGILKQSIIATWDDEKMKAAREGGYARFGKPEEPNADCLSYWG